MEDNKETIIDDNKEIDKKEDGKEVKTFSESEVDKRVTDAIAKREAKLKADFEKQLKAEIDKAIKNEKSLSQLTEEEKRIKELEDRETKLTQRENEIKLAGIKADIMKDLADSGLPVKASDFISKAIKQGTTEEAFELLKEFKELIVESNKAFLDSKIKENTFKPDAGKTAEVTLEEFRKMTTNQKLELATKNKAVYEKLSRDNRLMPISKK